MVQKLKCLFVSAPAVQNVETREVRFRTGNLISALRTTAAGEGSRSLNGFFISFLSAAAAAAHSSCPFFPSFGKEMPNICMLVVCIIIERSFDCYRRKTDCVNKTTTGESLRVVEQY